MFKNLKVIPESPPINCSEVRQLQQLTASHSEPYALRTSWCSPPPPYQTNQYYTMGNLLGSPITTKDTHVGSTHVSPDKNDGITATSSSLPYGISSMQGWRIHMEDAHIVQPFLFAEKSGVSKNLVVSFK